MKKTFTQKFWANRSKKGFTLVELVMAIAILAVIAAIAIPVVSSVIKTANQNTDINNGKTVDLLVKEAYTEVMAGMSSYTTDTTVQTVLQDQGLTDMFTEDGKFDYKTKDYSDTADQVKFYYDGKGSIVASIVSEAADDSNLTELEPSTTIETACG